MDQDIHMITPKWFPTETHTRIEGCALRASASFDGTSLAINFANPPGSNNIVQTLPVSEFAGRHVAAFLRRGARRLKLLV